MVNVKVNLYVYVRSKNERCKTHVNINVKNVALYKCKKCSLIPEQLRSDVNVNTNVNLYICKYNCKCKSKSLCICKK